MPAHSLLRRLALCAGLLLVAGCGTTFSTSYEQGVDPAVSRGWRVADVRVEVPAALTVSEAKGLMPRADIVWREDPPGDRHPQVAAIIETGARQGSAGLAGTRPVVLEITVERFHALTFEAERRLSHSGVHDVIFTARVTDARTGALLAGPERIVAALPALSGAEAREARARGITQKSAITAHVARTVAGWLGAGPDPRTSFDRRGI